MDVSLEKPKDIKVFTITQKVVAKLKKEIFVGSKLFFMKNLKTNSTKKLELVNVLLELQMLSALLCSSKMQTTRNSLLSQE